MMGLVNLLTILVMLLRLAIALPLYAFIAALGMWLAVELQHRRLLRALDPQRHGAAHHDGRERSGRGD